MQSLLTTFRTGLALVLGLGALARGAEIRAASRPNVIVVLTDDQGYGDLSCHGNPILRTPHLDRLHDQSVRLSNFHVAPVCTPTRGELMTGLYALRNKASMVPAGRNLMRRDIPVMPEVFRDSGYATGLFGKWHLGDTPPHRPMDRGFQRVVWHKGWGLASEIEYDNDYYYTRYDDGTAVRYSERYCANLWFDRAIEWMDERAEKGEPFFTYLALNTPHSPFEALPEDFALYRDKVKDPALAHFYGMIHNIDQNMARLDRWLEYRKIKDNTVVVFLNDNGTSRGESVFNAGMRGKKGSNYDGGHRAICFVRWPAGGLGQPRTVDAAAHVTDLLPTLVDLLGLKTPPAARFDGVSLGPVLRGEANAGKDRMFVVQFGGRQRPSKYHSCVVLDHWRLVGDKELYDLRSDPGQQSNVAAAHPAVLARMRGFYEQFWAEVSPGIDVVEPVPVGQAAGAPVVLTSNNWLEVDVDNRERVARAAGPARGGVWHIEAPGAGRYRVELARWPFHLTRALTAAGPDRTIGGQPLVTGEALPIASGVLSVNGGDPIAKGAGPAVATVVSFEVDLKPGRNTLQGWFRDAAGNDLRGAYYGRVTRL